MYDGDGTDIAKLIENLTSHKGVEDEDTADGNDASDDFDHDGYDDCVKIKS